MTEEKEDAKFIGSIARENIEGLAKLADEDEAGEMRKNPVKRKLKHLHRKYIKRPEARPVEV